MKELAIKRVLDESTKKQDVLIGGEVYSLHIKNNEVIITANYNYDIIYQVTSLDFYLKTL